MKNYKILILIFYSLIFSINCFSAEFQGEFIQGHFIIGKTKPNSKVKIDKKNVKVSDDGYFVFGLDRDRKYDVIITIENSGLKKKIEKKVLKRKYNIQRIDGLDEKRLLPLKRFTTELKRKITKLEKLEQLIQI